MLLSVSALAPVDPVRLQHFLDDKAPGYLQEYFTSGKYTGGQFERFAGGGDRIDAADRFTADDIVAVSLLSVRIAGQASLQILVDQAVELNVHLGQIPVDIDLWEASAAAVGADSAAQALWKRLDGIPGVGWVTAGKLLARKRPRLIPVYDRVVKAAFMRGHNDGWWGPLRAVLSENPEIVRRLGELRDQAQLGTEISLLRILDVSIWMRQDGKPEAVSNAE